MKKLLLILLCLPFIGFGQKTYVPDDIFEAYLESNGMGDGIAFNDSVLTGNINTVSQLSSINNYGIMDLTGIEDFTVLAYLVCGNNQLITLDVSNNTALIYLNCGQNLITSLDVSNNTALTQLSCDYNQLTSLDVSNNTALTQLNCHHNQLTSLDVSNNTALTQLSCDYNQLTSLDVSQNTALASIGLESNQLTSLNIGNNILITHLNTNFNPNLFCIDVDYPALAQSQYTDIDSWTSFDTNCVTALGCTDSTACNYDTLATIDDGSCLTAYGCTDSTACNYDASATCDDGSCLTAYGCTDSTAFNYDASTTCDDGSCVTPLGCTDSTACNYDTLATIDDNSCTYATAVFDCAGNCLVGSQYLLTLNDTFGDGWNANSLTINGVNYALPDINGDYNTSNVWTTHAGGYVDSFNICLDLSACTDIIYNPTGDFQGENSWVITDALGDTTASGDFSTAITSVGICYGCTDSTASNYDPNANTYDGSCIACIYGCIDSLACNYDITATCDTGNTCTGFIGCTDSTACNYQSFATCDDGSCILIIGCTDSAACNYDASATCDDGSCLVSGCTDATAFNYYASASCDDGSCIAVSLGCTDSLALNFDPLANTNDGSCCGASLSIPFGSQIGQDLDGSWGDDYGHSVSINSNGNIVAIGIPGHNGNGNDAGAVRVFENTSGIWTQIGQDIYGEAANDHSGEAVSISDDGNVVAIGAPNNNNSNGVGAGHVRVYENISGSWSQIGQDIDGEAATDASGFSVSLSSNGNIVAIGTPFNDGTGPGYDAGHVRVYENILGNWSQLGVDIDGDSYGDDSGTSVSLNANGNIVAIGAPKANANQSGQVRIFEYLSGNWLQIGQNINGDAVVDYSGEAVSISDDGNVVAIGAPNNDGNGVDAGHVRIFKNISGSWSQIGQDIDGESLLDYSGQTISLSGDGNKVAIGARFNDGNGIDAGHVRVYENILGNWSQLGGDIDGEAANDKFGWSVCLSSYGNELVVGAPYVGYDINGSQMGVVRVFSASDSITSSSSITSCDTYLWEGVLYDSSGVYTTVLTNISGCDSIAALYLTINSSSSGSSSITSCDTYLWEGVLYDSSGVYTTVLTNVSGCDSIATLNLTINYSSASTNTFYICSGQSITIGENTYNLSGVYIDTLSTSLGCDSIITTLVELSDLTLITSSSSITCSNWTDGSVSVNVAGGIPPYSYFWQSQDSTVLLSNLPDTTPLVSNLPEGSYIVTILDSLCSENASVNVDLNIAPADSMHPEICYASVDSSGFNKVVIKPLASPLVTSYIILREYSSNLYSVLDTIDANTLEYIDSTSNPAVQAERYKVLAIDVCGNNSDTSDFHKTVHLTMSVGINGAVNLIWNQYEGYQITDYLIYRGNDTSNMNMIGSIQGNLTSYTDLNPPTGYLIYQIRAFAQNCEVIPNAFTLPDILESNIIDYNSASSGTLSVTISSQNPSCVTCNDGFAVASAANGTNPYTYMWSNGVSGSFNFFLGVGTYIVFASDFMGNTTNASVTLTAPVFGCMDSFATNYDPAATVDDGTCIYPTCSEDSPTELFASDVIHNRATINWDNMNSPVCIVDQYRIRYREAGTSSWSTKTMSGPVGSCNFASQKTDKLILNLTANTNYEYQMKAWYCGGGASSWSGIETFTTLDNCPNVGNLAVYGATPTKATFTWDASNGLYSFVRLKARVDSISNPTGADFFQIGGAGVSYGTFTKNKNNLTPSQTYRGQARTYCDPNGGGWKSLSWTPLVYWTQPTLRIEGGEAISHLAIYPNPSKDVFNITFTSERVQDLRVRVLNVVGEEIVKEELQKYIGEYTKQINLEDNAKGIYFLEIETNNGIINKKLVLQ